MIYQLVKRDPLWKVPLGLALICPLAGWLGFLNPGQPPRFLLIWILPYFLFALSPVHRRCNLFEAALPIRGRHLFAARLLLCAISIWLPILSASATMAALGGASNEWMTAFVKLGAMLTLLVICFQSFHIQEFDIPVPAWWPAILGAAVFVMVLVMEEVSTSIVLTTCGLVTVALFWKSWKAVPESFQIAPLKAAPAGSDRRSAWLPSTIWRPLIRTLFPNKSFLMLGAIATFSIVGGAGSPSNFLGVMFVLIALTHAMAGLPWLLTLPISRHKLFLAVLLPPLGVFMLFDLAGLYYSGRPPRDSIIIFLTMAAAALVAGIAAELPYIQLGRLPERTKVVPVLLLTVPFVAAMYFDPKGKSNLTVSWLSPVLPASLLLVIAIGIAVLGALYWLVYKAFCRIEVRQPPRNPVNRSRLA